MVTKPLATRVAARHLEAREKPLARIKSVGEVRFIKDRGGDTNEWGWGTPGPSERDIDDEFLFNAKYLKPLAETLRSALMGLGHVTSAHARFVKIKSRNVSPDGNLGGKGYIQKIPDMRRQLMNCIEALSAFTDTIYDELAAPHWNPAEDRLSPRDRDEVKDIIQDAEDIKQDPEEWAEEEEEEMDEAKPPSRGKTASFLGLFGPKDPQVEKLRDSIQTLAARASELVDTLKSDVSAVEAQAETGWVPRLRSDLEAMDSLVRDAIKEINLVWRNQHHLFSRLNRTGAEDELTREWFGGCRD